MSPGLINAVGREVGTLLASDDISANAARMQRAGLPFEVSVTLKIIQGGVEISYKHPVYDVQSASRVVMEPK